MKGERHVFGVDVGMLFANCSSILAIYSHSTSLLSPDSWPLYHLPFLTGVNGEQVADGARVRP